MKKKKTSKKKEKPFVIVRAHTAGVHAGFLESRNETTVVLSKSIRLWRWCGGSLSEVAAHGPAKGDNKFGAELEELTIISPQGLEIAKCSEAAMKAIQAVPEWKA